MPNLRHDLPGWASTRERRVLWLFTEKKLSRRRIAETLGLKYGAVCRIIRRFHGNRFAYRQGAAPKVMGSGPNGIRPFGQLSEQGQKKRLWLMRRTHRLRDREGLTLAEVQAKYPKDGQKLIAYLWSLPAGFDLYGAEAVREEQAALAEETEQGQLWDGMGLDPRGKGRPGDKPCPTMPPLSASGARATTIQVNGDTLHIPRGATVRIKRGDLDIEVTI